MTKVVILQHRLLHYRIAFFQRLKSLLSEHGVELVLVHGQASPSELKRKDEGHLDWAVKVKNRFLSVYGRDLLWQPFPVSAEGASLVVVMQESRILSNYPLLFRLRQKGARIAYWGHGKNYQSYAPKGIRERWKKALLTSVDWWFAYTELTEKYLVEQGYDKLKISNLNNAIDVTSFQREIDLVDERELSVLRSQLGLKVEDKVAIFCGSLYAEKKIALLLAAIDYVKEKVPQFHFIVVGDGPEGGLAREAARTREWVHVMGVKKGREKAALFKISNVQLNPGLVGLHVLDAFAAGLPMITTSNALHSPEIAYLVNGVNGYVVDGDDVQDYAKVVIDVMLDDVKRNEMAAKCRSDALKYTVEGMARSFSSGVLQVLERA